MAEMSSVQDESNAQTSGNYDNPVYKKISLINGEVNRMSKQELQEKLASHRLDTRGIKDVLKKRLKNFYKKKKLAKAHIKPLGTSDVFYDYILVIDFEATCNEHNPHKFKHEIIEFPVVLIDTVKLEIVDTFQSYCQPRLNPKLSEFCTKLTGITQGTVNSAPPFREVLKSVEEWMNSHKLGKKDAKFAILSDGPWDFSRFLYNQCFLSRLHYPKWARKWINVKKSYSNYYGGQRPNLQTMLENLGMSFKGRQHCGLDDATNIGRVVLRMLEDGAELRVNERMFSHKMQKLHDRQDGEAEVCPISKNDAENDASSSEDSDDAGPKPCSDEKETRPSDTCLCDLGVDNIPKPRKGTMDLSHSFEKMAIRGSTDARDYSEDEGIDDLLSYYNLQKT